MRIRGFEPTREEFKKNVEPTLLPLRATKSSAGYDLYAPYDVTIKPQEKVLIWTDVKAYMPQGEMLLLDVTSSMGGKLDLMLANTIGILDADYYSNEGNDGNIGVCLRNLKPAMELDGYIRTHQEGRLSKAPYEVDVPMIKDMTEENTVVIKQGEKIGQLIFMSYFTSDNCNSDGERIGGWGSTNK